MPYAANGRISQEPIEGGVEITDLQYQEGLEGMLSGKLISVSEGFQVVDPELASEQTSEPDPGVERIAEIQHRLTMIDVESLRPLRAITAGVGTDFDKEKLFQLEVEAAGLREELAALTL